MKQPKKLTRNQKMLVAYNRIPNPDEWMFLKDLNDTYFVVVSKDGKKQKVIDRTRREKVF